MVSPIEDYAVLSDCRTAALVSCDGGIDWLCLPRFDSASVFGALLGGDDQGRWSLRPVDGRATSERHYLGDTLALVTRWTTPTGVVEVVDVMPLRDERAELVRRVRGVSGTVRMRQELRIRFDYARTMPWMRQEGTDEDPLLVAVAGPDAVVVRGVRLKAVDHAHSAEFEVASDAVIDLSMAWFPSHQRAPKRLDVDRALERTLAWWSEWASAISYDGPHRDAVVRSLLTLRALTDDETGGIVAAATTSLPEQFGGGRNWDYRYVWLRDASLTLQALLAHGFEREAQKWRAWLLRAVAGSPEDVQIMYGLAGERNLPEREMPSLPGYDGASPVRIGNAAVDQYQADVIGEVMVALHEARMAGVDETEFSWPLQRALLGFVETNWQRPDNGIWEIRGEPRHFTHSRVMIWAALDRGVRAVRESGLPGPVETWERLREEVRAEIEAQGYDAERGHFVQSYGSPEVDASLLVLPMVGFVAADDPRMLGTVAELERALLQDGLLHRYRTESSVDGLAGGEHPFLACSFWLVRQYADSGRIDDARTLMDRLVGLCNDVGLLAEEYDVEGRRHAGNTPQALSHLALVQAADAIAAAG
ncbi:glycoside hydrolase family 15 protein [Rathayibacter tritici]|uniref:Glucoamylase n=1 Tax=Rathayibacter tritici TaxID=33888 RepID=A0A169BWB1_9MICO|nr:glycoside hydrolase family 15 protein [Rathayibacter tritici]AND16055.1 glucoamylase [Rathayibacter tritici]PPF30000.1 glycoside hydrolase family 15 protein [Rathayibacter tritici]PPF68697.1 glycoside hydrolase family 15 protein [Rathayibacter tritici]PPG07337.1 glycoside hydrolase family 15 protein [Rathayibacter tritici]PPI11953.1 glycoside hydrolase family 15 protein [Rathayibacter tritici]